jgi:AAA domain-containing protein
VNGPINLLDENEVGAFIEQLRKVNPVLVVVDTLSRCLVGADENAQSAMTTAVDNLDRIRTSVDGLTVLVLHHLNAAGKRERGSSVLFGALDTQLRLKAKMRGAGNNSVAIPGLLALDTDKQKDIDELDSAVTLRRHEIEIEGEFETDGKPCVSLIWLPKDAETVWTDDDAIFAYVAANPGCSKTAVANHVTGRKADILARIESIVSAGRLRLTIEKQRHLLAVATTGSGGHPTGVSTSGTTAGRWSEPLKELEKPQGNRTDSWPGTGRNECGGTTAPELNREPVELIPVRPMTTELVIQEVVR